MKIVYQRDDKDTSQIYIMNADGSAKTNLTMGRSHDMRPAISPDGKKVAFTGWNDEGMFIYLMDIDGSNRRKITKDSASVDMPAFIPTVASE